MAKQLLSFNEHNEWKDPNDLTCEESLTQDNEIFHIAKSITCIHFINVVREDFLKGLIGMPMVGLSAQVDILYVKSDLSLMCAYSYILDRTSEV